MPPAYRSSPTSVAQLVLNIRRTTLELCGQFGEPLAIRFKRRFGGHEPRLLGVEKKLRTSLFSLGHA